MTRKITLFEELAEITKPEIAGIDFNKPQPKVNRALIYDINSTEFDKECPAHDFDIEHNGFTYIIEIYKFSARYDATIEQLNDCEIWDWRISHLDKLENDTVIDPTILSDKILIDWEQKAIEWLYENLDEQEYYQQHLEDLK